MKRWLIVVNRCVHGKLVDALKLWYRNWTICLLWWVSSLWWWSRWVGLISEDCNLSCQRKLKKVLMWRGNVLLLEFLSWSAAVEKTFESAACQCPLAFLCVRAKNKETKFEIVIVSALGWFGIGCIETVTGVTFILYNKAHLELPYCQWVMVFIFGHCYVRVFYGDPYCVRKLYKYEWRCVWGFRLSNL